MIPVEETDPPANFDAECRQPGLRWLAAHPPWGGDRLPNYWREFIPDLCNAFHKRCGYLAMLDMNGTVDHFLSTDSQRHLAYEWSNYRYATGWLNSSKQTLDQAILDPFEVMEEWFEVDLASLHLKVTPAIPKRLARRAAFTINRLGLDYGRRTIQNRTHYYTEYRNGAFPLDYLEQIAPLLATAVRRETLRAHLAATPSVSRQDIADVCSTTHTRAMALARIWRLAGHLRALGRGRNVRYQLA
jgi:hypothetical protein